MIDTGHYVNESINACLSYDGSDNIEAIGACLVAFRKVSLHYYQGTTDPRLSRDVWIDCVNKRILADGVLRNKFEVAQ